MRYFPIKRVAVMTLGGVAFVVSWVPPIAALVKYSGVNWLAIISGILTLCFAYWVIIDLYIKLESKPAILISRLGVLALTKPLTHPRKVEYFYHILIVNSSPDKTLGIIDIRLQLKYKNRTKYIPPYVGIPESELGKAEKGEISSNLLLQPNESKEGQLAFVEECDGEGKDVGLEFAHANIVIRDAQKRIYIFPTTFEKIASDYSFGDD
jgi:hypothetical protein